MDIYSINLAGLLAVCGVLFAVQKRSSNNNNKNDEKTATTKSNKAAKKQQPTSNSQRPFLVVYALVMGADWLQGPFLYPLYHDEHNLPHALISTLFTTGFLSGALSGAFIGTLADRHGRKTACLFFCMSYALSCLLTMFPLGSTALLFAGRILGGLSTSLLFSVFESWMVADFQARGLDRKGGSLSATFGVMSTVNSLVAIGSGVVSEWLVSVSGTRKAPFMASAAILVVAFAVILGSWDEYYGKTTSTEPTSKDQGKNKSSPENTKPTNSLSQVLTNPQILSLGLASTIFEGSMYLFVFFWTPALRSTTSTTSQLPYGVIFASFMASCLAASLAFNTLMSSSGTTAKPVMTHFTLLVFVLGTSAFCFFLSAYPSSEQSAFWVFCLFEAAVGAYWPTMGTLKGKLIDDGIRSQVYGLLRVPLNVFVVVSLLVTEEGAAAYGRVFMTCGMMLAGTSGVLSVVGL